MKIVRTLSSLLLGVTIAGVNASSAKSATLFQDNFDSESHGLSKKSLTNWNVTAGNVDVIGSRFYDLYPGNGTYLDMDGTPAANATIETKQLFNLTAGTYQLSFKLGNNTFSGNKLLVQVGSVFSEIFDATSTLTSISRSFSVTTPTSVSLLFAEKGPADQGGSILDNVMLEQTQATSVPEPASVLGLLAFGTLGAGSMLKRKQQKVKA